MFDSLSDRFSQIFRQLKGHHRISENNIQDAVREVRKALLEADVNYTVVKDFILQVKDKALGQEVLQSVSPSQMLIKIIHDEMVALLSKNNRVLPLQSDYQVILMAGLQGGGKTTSSAKLAKWYQGKGLKPFLISADTSRPAAKEQLKILADQVGTPFYTDFNETRAIQIVKDGLQKAGSTAGINRVIVDTAGRLHVEEELMNEIRDIMNLSKPSEIFLTLDAMAGQDAVKIGEAFSSVLELTGIILSKLDGDARGGAALSMAAITGKPILFVGLGEKISQWDQFHPDRMASRILGMGDIVSLVEKAQEVVDEKEAKKLEEKFLNDEFDFDDFLSSIRQMRKLGSMKSIFQMLPGMPKVKTEDIDEKKVDHVQAMIFSMTPGERRKPGIINGSRKKRIAKGSGRTVQEVNRLLDQFRDMKKMMKKMKQFMNPAMLGKQG